MPAIVVLSAKNAERLKEQAANLKNYIESNPCANLFDIAYTLQVGREAMEERLAIVSNDKEELATQLAGYLNGKEANVLTGNIRKSTSDFSLEGEAGRAYIETAIKNKE